MSTRMRARISPPSVATAGLLLVLACATDHEPARMGGDAGLEPAPRTLTHRFDPIAVNPGQELSGVCQSWTFENEGSLFVRSVRTRNDGAWHHSNWFFARTAAFRGGDGTWRCADRGLDEVTGALAGGVFFAQSTQSLDDVQAFPPGHALKIPLHSQLVGSVHLINTTREPIDTAITFEIETLPEEEVTTELVGLALTNYDLALPPRAESRFGMTCDMRDLFARRRATEPNFRIHYVLPHFHELGNYFRLELVGGTRDGEVVYETHQVIGDPLGATLTTAVDATGADGLRFECGFDNPRDETVHFGIGDQEMCVFLAFTDAGFQIGGVSDVTRYVGNVDGIERFEAGCDLFSIE